jgi:hypothetical protein
MLHHVLSTAVSLRGQTWLSPVLDANKWRAFQLLVHVPNTIGGIFRIFPNK